MTDCVRMKTFADALRESRSAWLRVKHATSTVTQFLYAVAEFDDGSAVVYVDKADVLSKGLKIEPLPEKTERPKEYSLADVSGVTDEDQVYSLEEKKQANGKS